MANAPDNPSHIVIVLLAAGGSTRMKGVDKLLERIDGIPLLHRSTLSAIASNVNQVFVVTQPNDVLRQKTVSDLAIQIVENPDWQSGMASSIKAGLDAMASSTQAVIIALADMPDVSTQDYNSLISAFDPQTPAMICRATTQDNKSGHPVLIGAAHFAGLAKLQGDNGAKSLLQNHKDSVILVQTNGQNARTDLDTPQDWAAYRAR